MDLTAIQPHANLVSVLFLEEQGPRTDAEQKEIPVDDAVDVHSDAAATLQQRRPVGRVEELVAPLGVDPAGHQTEVGLRFEDARVAVARLEPAQAQKFGAHRRRRLHVQPHHEAARVLTVHRQLQAHHLHVVVGLG